MKNLKTAFLALLSISMFMVACKDDEETVQKNHMTYDNKEYDLAEGVIENYGNWSSIEGYNFDITLISAGFTIHESNGEIDSISGIGTGISIELYSSDSTDIATGTYAYDEDGLGQAGTFSYAGGGTDYNTATEEGEEFEVKEGTVTVVKNGTTYELLFIGTTEDNKELFCYWNGSLKRYDYLDDKKSEKIKKRMW